MSRGYVEFFLLGVFLIGFAFTSGLISKSIPPYMITPSPVLTPQPTPLPPIAPCGQKCGFYFACGAPHSISGKIVDQRGQGVAGLSVIIFDHNRDNPSFLRAIDFATTDASGNFREQELVCGGLNPNTGDTYSVRPDWIKCIPGKQCMQPKPYTIEDQQANKPPPIPDCAKSNSCNFQVTIYP